MPKPIIGGCGGSNQPPCPPVNSISDSSVPRTYTLEDMKAHGWTCYKKGICAGSN
jgi:hypothetical protein